MWRLGRPKSWGSLSFIAPFPHPPGLWRRVSEAVGGCRLQTHGVGGPSTDGNLCQIAGRPRVPAPTQDGTEVGHLIPFPALGLHGGCGGGGECLESRPPGRGWQSTEVVVVEGQPLPASGELGSPDAPRGAASREQEPQAEQRPGPRAAHAAPGALRARPLVLAAPSLPSTPARAASLPGRADPGSQRSGGRAGGRRARGGGARSRPRPAPRRGPPPPAPPLPTRKEPRGAGRPCQEARQEARQVPT